MEEACPRPPPEFTVHLLREVLLNYGHHPFRKCKKHASNRVEEPSDPIKFSQLPVSPLFPEGRAFEYRLENAKSMAAIGWTSQVIPLSFCSFLSALYLQRDVLLSTVAKVQKTCQQSGGRAKCSHQVFTASCQPFISRGTCF